MGPEAALRQGPAVRGLPRAAVLLGVRDAAVQLRDAHGRRLPRSSGPRRHGVVRARRRQTAARVDDHTVDAAVQPGDRRRPRHRLRGLHRRRRPPVRARRVARRRVRARAGRRRAHGNGEGSRPRRPPLHAAVPVLRRHTERVRDPRGRLRHHRGRHRRGAHGSRLRRGRPARVRSRRDPRGRSRRREGPLHRRGARLRGHAGVQRQRRHRPRSEGEGRRRPPRQLRAQLSALLAHRHAAHLQGRVELVREGHRDQGPHARAQPADQLGAGARARRIVRQVARRRARLVDQPQPLLGLTAPDLEERRPGLPAHRRLRQPRRARARLRCAADRPAPSGDRRARPPEPRRPDRHVDDAPHPRRARLLVRVGVDAVRPGALPVREQRVVRVALSRRLHRRVHRPDAWLVLHAARAGDGAVRQARVLHVRGARRAVGRRRPEAVEAPAQLPGPDRGLRHRRLRRDALGDAVVSRAPRRRHRRGSPDDGRVRAPGAHADLERVVLPVALRERGRREGHDDQERRTRPRPLRARQGSPAGRRRHREDGRLRPLGRVLVDPRVPRLAQQLVHPPQSRSVLGGRPRRGQHVAHRPVHPVPRGRAAPAAHVRCGVPRSHGCRLGAPRALAHVG